MWVREAQKLDFRKVLRRRRGRSSVDGRVIDLGRRARRWLDDWQLGSKAALIRVDLSGEMTVTPTLEPPQHVGIAVDKPHFGGERFWLLCPACGRRAAILYRPQAPLELRCRRCWGLEYESTQLDRCDRALRKARRIRERIGGSGSSFGFPPSRPRGAHEEVWARRVAALRAAEHDYMAEVDGAVRRALGYPPRG